MSAYEYLVNHKFSTAIPRHMLSTRLDTDKFDILSFSLFFLFDDVVVLITAGHTTVYVITSKKSNAELLSATDRKQLMTFTAVAKL